MEKSQRGKMRQNAAKRDTSASPGQAPVGGPATSNHALTDTAPIHEQGELVGCADGAIGVEVGVAASCMDGKWGSSNVAATYIRSAMLAVM